MKAGPIYDTEPFRCWLDRMISNGVAWGRERLRLESKVPEKYFKQFHSDVGDIDDDDFSENEEDDYGEDSFA